MESLTGLSFLGNSRGTATPTPFHASDPATGQPLEPDFYAASDSEIDQACTLAWQAFLDYRQCPDSKRAEFLRCIADEIDAAGEAITQRGVSETGLPAGRLTGERGRTCGQLRLFADLLEDGNWVQARIDLAQPERTPLPKSDIRCQQRPLGPVAIFGASNFPLAFSVAGGDTASALAAGCPVVVKAHEAHPGVSEIVATAIAAAVKKCGLHPGVFSMLNGSGKVVGKALVSHPAIKAVGFTGSRSGGCALMQIAANRLEPIPVYAEMSSINPVVILPGALAERATALAEGLQGSVTLGAGQFCTNPGLVFLPAGTDADQFALALAKQMQETPAAVMLTDGISQAFQSGVAKMASHPKVETLVPAAGQEPSAGSHATPAVFRTTIDDWVNSKEMVDEVFGPSTLLVTYDSREKLIDAIGSLEGQLTATLHGADDDWTDAHELVEAMELKAGRLVFNGFPTGVEVCHSMVHGGPFPATSDGRSTSVGTQAIYRFTRPVAWQDCPDALLPIALQSGNPRKIDRLET